MLNLLFIWTGVFSEFISFLFYNRYKVKKEKLKGTGRMTDIEIAHNWQTFFKVAIIAIPLLLLYFFGFPSKS